MEYTFTGTTDEPSKMFANPFYTIKTNFMKKNLYLLLLLIMASTIYMYGCKKTDSATDPVAITNLDTSLVNSLQLWLSEQKDHVGKNGKPMIDSIMSNTKWDQGEQNYISPFQSMIYIPVSNQSLGLTFFYNTQKRTVDSCFLVDVSSDKSNYSYKKMDVIQARYLQPDAITNHGFTGQITDFTLDNKFKSETKYNNGIVASTKTLRSKGAAKRGNITTLQTCIAWYWVTTYGDGTEYWQYMYTQCSDCEEQPFSIGITTAKTYIRKGNCVSGGGPGPVEPDDQCDISKDEAIDILNTSQFETSSNMSRTMPSGEKNFDSNSGKIREPVMLFVDGVRVGFYAFKYNSNYEAVYTGIRYKNDINDQYWKFEQVGYGGLSERGTNLPPCYTTYLSSISSPAVISNDETSAKAISAATAVLKINCTQGEWVQKVYTNQMLHYLKAE